MFVVETDVHADWVRVPVMHVETDCDSETVGDDEYEPDGEDAVDAV